MLKKTRIKTARAESIIAEAKRHVGYRAQPDRKSAFQLKPYLGKPWGGTFIDRVLHDALGDFAEVRFVSTVTALGYYVNRHRVYQKAKPGDIVFFNFSTDPKEPFEQPACGVVIEVLGNGSIRTVEGETATGVPQGSQLADGVFERVRYAADVLGYVRPKPVVRTEPSGEIPTVRYSYFESNPKTKSRATETLQRALNRVTGLTFNRGKLDGETRAAFGLAARMHGTVENRGELTGMTLQQLADATGEYDLE